MERDSSFANDVFHVLTFQLTRSRGAWLEKFPTINTIFDISTHTLTWSVTLHVATLKFFICYFNSHAHVERDYCFSTLALYHANFNSHAHVERDVIEPVAFFCVSISTHTLTWSVTPSKILLPFVSVFQLTRSRGAWQPLFIFNPVRVNFNSHAHVERDAADSQPLFAVCISTHTLTWSVTTWGLMNTNTYYISTHTLTWSVTYRCYHVTTDDWISTHTLTWSVTGILRQQRSNWKFQLTRSRGAWRINAQSKHAISIISTHTLTWSVTVQIRQFLGQQTFQLTRSRGAWHTTGAGTAIVFNFNSHAHVERDT